jgi:mono/diheme cytochrome c family protein
MLRQFRMVSAVALPLAASYLSATPQKTVTATPSAETDALARAKEIYKRDCLVCHGTNGDGKTGIAVDRELVLPNWTDPKSLDGKPDQLLFQIIRHGRAKMPAESTGRADDQEVRNLIRYIRSMSGDASAKPPEASTPVSQKD